MAFDSTPNGDVVSIEGYASLFGEEDLNGDVVEPGAFSTSLKTRPAEAVKMLHHHTAEAPIGRWTDIYEDGWGLFVRGEILQSVPRGAETAALIEAGALDGLSIGFRTVRSRKAAGAAVRRLIEIDLWEVSVVTFPMAPGARVTRLVRDAAEAPRLRRNGLSAGRGQETPTDVAHLFAEAVAGAADIIRS
ncbi:MAG: HK97 family phage prohead protease [Pseudomonadota bacterium]